MISGAITEAAQHESNALQVVGNVLRYNFFLKRFYGELDVVMRGEILISENCGPPLPEGTNVNMLTRIHVEGLGDGRTKGCISFIHSWHHEGVSGSEESVNGPYFDTDPVKCEKCSLAKAVCGSRYETSGGDSEYVTWTHTCKECGHSTESESQYGIYGTDNEYHCPFPSCGNKFP